MNSASGVQSLAEDEAVKLAINTGRPITGISFQKLVTNPRPREFALAGHRITDEPKFSSENRELLNRTGH